MAQKLARKHLSENVSIEMSGDISVGDGPRVNIFGDIKIN